MVYTFVINIVYLNLNSIINILNAITTKYRFLANKNIKFWELSLVIILGFWPFEPHFLINFFLIKKRVIAWSLLQYSIHVGECSMKRHIWL